jgi:D-beta-D-heptose 7-phosphate kinase/D-beta-D-heptose 1-phosphate adenosyltransferase
VPVVEVTSHSVTLGGAANVASNIASLGGQAAVLGIIGEDGEGRALESLLDEKAIIKKYLVRDASRPTSIKTRVIAHSQQVVRFDMEDKNRLSGAALQEMKRRLAEILPGYDAVVVSDYNKGVVTPELMRLILRHKCGKRFFIAVDPKVGHFHMYKGVSVMTPNVKEASEGSGVEITDEDSLMKAGRTLLRRLKLKAVLITRGEEGMSLFTAGRTCHVQTAAKKVFDVTGAGDTVIAAFSLAHAAGASLEEAARIANHAAGIVVGQVGTVAVTARDLRESLKEGYLLA